MLKVSIIVPVYNVESILSRCLDSLVNQSLKEIEIICVNDASTDNSLKILYKYAAQYKNIRVIDLKENLHQGGARNRGIEIAEGDFIGFVDSDDWIDLKMYEKLYNLAISSNADLVSCDYDTVNSEGNILSESITDQNKFCGEISEQIRDEFLITTGSVWSKLYKKDLLVKNNVWFPEKIFYEDNYFVPIVALYAHRYAHISECLYHYFVNINSTTQKRNSKNIEDRIKSLDLQMNYFKSNKLLEKYPKSIEYIVFRTLYNTITMYLNTFDSPQMKFLHEIHLRFTLYQLKSKIKHPYYYTDTNSIEKIEVSLFLFSPNFFMLYWKLKKTLNNILK